MPHDHQGVEQPDLGQLVKPVRKEIDQVDHGQGVRLLSAYLFRPEQPDSPAACSPEIDNPVIGLGRRYNPVTLFEQHHSHQDPLVEQRQAKRLERG